MHPTALSIAGDPLTRSNNRRIRQTLTFTPVVLAGVVLVAAIGIALATAPAPSERQAFVAVRWATLYDNLQELSNASSLIVRGKVVGTTGTYSLGDESPDPSMTSFMTVYKVTVNKILLDRAGAGVPSDGSILVSQMSGTRNGVVEVVEDQVPYEIGGEYVLALVPYAYEKAPPDGFIAVGGPQGEFRVTNGLVYSTDHFQKSADWIAVRASGAPAASFDQAVQEASR